MKKLKKLMRSGERLTRQKKPFGQKRGNLTGVCRGLADYFGISPLFVRAGFVIGFLIAPLFAALGYLFLAGIMPDQRGYSFIQDTDWSKLKSGDMLANWDLPSSKPRDHSDKELRFTVCERCNTAVREGSKFCHHCGAKM